MSEMLRWGTKLIVAPAGPLRPSAPEDLSATHFLPGAHFPHAPNISTMGATLPQSPHQIGSQLGPLWM